MGESRGRCGMMLTSRWVRSIALSAGFALGFLGSLGPAFGEYEVIDVRRGGTIKGVATWKGEIPKVPPLKVFADMDFCGDTSESPVLQVDPKTRGVRFVLVYLEKIEQGKAPEHKYWLHMGKDDREPNSRLCQFEEHVFPFIRTHDIAVVNFDNILHNPHFFNEKHASLFNIAMPTPTMKWTRRSCEHADRACPISVTCTFI
jgi:hypothetical protein